MGVNQHFQFLVGIGADKEATAVTQAEMSHLSFDDLTCNLDVLVTPVKLIRIANRVMLGNEDFWAGRLLRFECFDVTINRFVAARITQ